MATALGVGTLFLRLRGPGSLEQLGLGLVATQGSLGMLNVALAFTVDADGASAGEPVSVQGTHLAGPVIRPNGMRAEDWRG